MRSRWSLSLKVRSKPKEIPWKNSVVSAVGVYVSINSGAYAAWMFNCACAFSVMNQATAKVRTISSFFIVFLFLLVKRIQKYTFLNVYSVSLCILLIFWFHMHGNMCLFAEVSAEQIFHLRGFVVCFLEADVSVHQDV